MFFRAKPLISLNLVRASLGLVLSSTLALSSFAMSGPPTLPRNVQPARTTVAVFDAPSTTTARQRIAAFLSRLTLIRVRIVSAPGMGHQSANLRMIERLRALGYTGRIQAIYADKVQEKLPLLHNEFNTHLKHQRTWSATLGSIEWIADSVSQPIVNQERASIGIQGAADDSQQLSMFNMLNTNLFLQLQPRLWNTKHTPRELIIRNEARISFEHLDKLGTAVSRPTPESWSGFFSDKMKAPEDSRKREFLSGLFENLKKFELLPAYSVDYPFSPGDAIATIATGLKNAMTIRPRAFRGPVIIPVFSRFDDLSKFRSVSKALSKLEIPYLDAGDIESLPAILAAKPSEIIFVQVGSVPLDVFDTVFLQATLPALLEGKNLTNTMIDAGLPFLNIKGSLADLEFLFRRGRLTRDADTTIRSAFHSMDERRYPRDLTIEAQAMTNYILQLKDSDSSLSAFFQSLRNDPESLNRDLVAQALMLLDIELEVRGMLPPLPSRRCEASFSRSPN